MRDRGLRNCEGERDAPGIYRVIGRGCRGWGVSNGWLWKSKGPRDTARVNGMVNRLRLRTGEREDKQIAITDPSNQQLIVGWHVPRDKVVTTLAAVSDRTEGRERDHARRGLHPNREIRAAATGPKEISQ